jgi:hypothetical protein
MRLGRAQRIVMVLALAALGGEAVLMLGTALLAAAALVTLGLFRRGLRREDEPAR